MSEVDKPWAQLVSTTDNDSDPIEISKSKFIIGRSKAADLCLLGNKLVSGSHCFILRKDDGSVWIQDTSTNGTLLNLTQKVIGKQVKLNHGDEIHIVYRKPEVSLNVAYLFQDLDKLRAEEAEETSSEQTQLYNPSDELDTTETVEDCSDGFDLPNKRKVDECAVSSDEMPASKKSKVSKEDVPKPDEPMDATAAAGPSEPSQQTQSDTKVDQNSIKSAEIKEPKQDPAGEGSLTETEKKKSGDEAPSKPATADDDAFEESLVCIICQEILHDCVSCQPCMHSFCAGCYSDWMSRSHECPSCRGTVERVNKNYIVNNLIEAYLKLHPEKKRPEEELKALDARSKILKDTVKPPKLKKTMSEIIDDAEDEDDDDGSLSNSDEDEDDNNDGGIAPPPFPTGTHFAAGLGFGSLHSLFPYKPPKTVCRECPEYSAPVVKGTIASATAMVTNIASKVVDMVKGKPADSGASTSSAADAGEGPSTSGAGGSDSTPASTPPRPKYTCNTHQVHILCQCCLQPMPDRRMDAHRDNTVPKQHCSLCYRLFCHLYWGCTNVSCLGCIGKFKDMKFTKQSVGNIILLNNFESEVLRNYVTSQGKTMDDVLQECLVQLEAGKYTCKDQMRGLASNSILCYGCALGNFRDLVYQYRKAIPKEDLPAAVTARPDCYWGENCRTQRNKPHHAANFNHICKQTR